jgi:tetratricopeptide (TPR) repeat protein
MAGPIEPVRLPGALLQRDGSGLTPITAATVIERVVVGDYALEEYLPLPLNLEWRLSALHWSRAGVTPFISNDVPYLVNNNGRASADAAAVLFANCMDAPADQPIHVLELGAGTALFARYVLDEFRALCERDDRDFYDRLAMRVTDGSPASVARWAASGMFADHAPHVSISVCDAQMPDRIGDGALRAVFANYVLDSLPAAVLRWDVGGWQQLCARASIRADTVMPPSLSGRNAAWLRMTAGTTDPDELAELLPLLPFLESELAFRPIDGNGPPDYEHHLGAGPGPATSVIYPFGALQCLDALIPQLHPDGFVLIRDYASGDAESTFVGAQRFGGAAAMPLNFTLIERHLQNLAVDVVRPDNEGLMHTRLLARAPIASTRTAFVQRFSAASTAADSWTLESVARERAAQGLHHEALGIYQQAIADHPRDWRLIAAAAQFAAGSLGDPSSGVDLACAALQLNPWYSPFLWNVLGECLRAVGRDEEAHDCHLEAARVDPGDADTYVHLAKSWLTRGDAASSLQAVALGLAADVDAMHRHPLLDVQTAAIEQLSRAGTARREAALRRQARGTALASTTAPGATRPDQVLTDGL